MTIIIAAQKCDSSLVNKLPRVKAPLGGRRRGGEENSAPFCGDPPSLPSPWGASQKSQESQNGNVLYSVVHVKTVLLSVMQNVEHIYHLCCSDPFAGFCLNKVPYPVCLSLHCRCPPLTPHYNPQSPPPSTPCGCVPEGSC